MQIHPSASHAVGRPQADGGAPDDAPDGKLCPQGLSSAQGEEGVEAGPGGGEAGAGGGVAGEVEVAGEEEGRGEEG